MLSHDIHSKSGNKNSNSTRIEENVNGKSNQQDVYHGGLDLRKYTIRIEEYSFIDSAPLEHTDYKPEGRNLF
jgi:hypothetical protein